MLTAPFVMLCCERFNAQDNTWGIVFIVISIINLLVLIAFVVAYCKGVDYSFHRLFEIKCQCDCKCCNIATMIKIVSLLYNIIVFGVSIFCYIKFVFKLITFIFFEFEKTDIPISGSLLALIYICGYLKTKNLQLKKYLKEFECALLEIMINNKNEQSKAMKLKFLFECKGK